MSLRARAGRVIRSMNLRARPSKSYLHRLFDADVARYSNCARAADVASADFKNAHLFESDVYYAVDIDEAGLRDGLDGFEDADTDFQEGQVDAEMMARHEESSRPTRVAVLGDMRDSLFPPDSLDLVVSTHTFGHLPPSDHPTVVENFCEALRPGGTLLLQLADSDWYEGALKRRLTDAFETVEIHRYRVATSVAYERLAADGEGAVVFPHDQNRLKHYLMILLSAGLLQFERLPVPGGNSLYLRCLGRK